MVASILHVPKLGSSERGRLRQVMSAVNNAYTKYTYMYMQ